MMPVFTCLGLNGRCHRALPLALSLRTYGFISSQLYGLQGVRSDSAAGETYLTARDRSWLEILEKQ